MADTQLELSFEAGLTDRFPEFRDCLRATVYGGRRPFKAIAADLDYKPSFFSKMFSEPDSEDKRNFPVERLPELVKVTGDMTPIYWLVERLLEDGDKKRRRAIDDLTKLMPQLEQLLKTVS